MIEEGRMKEFFQNLASNIDDLEFCVQLCENNVKSEDSELSVIAMSTLRVFDEIRLYLDYFNSEIAKKFGFRGLSEWGRIKKDVLEDFAREIEEGDLDSRSARLNITDSLIKKWNDFPKEKETDIINRERGKDTLTQ